MSDDRVGLLAVAASFVTSAALGGGAFLKWLVSRRDRTEDKEKAERAEFSAERSALHAEIRADADRYRKLWLASDENAEVWERRCRWMDRKAQALLRQLDDDRRTAGLMLERAGITPPVWPDNPPLPKLEDI